MTHLVNHYIKHTKLPLISLLLLVLTLTKLNRILLLSPLYMLLIGMVYLIKNQKRYAAGKSRKLYNKLIKFLTD